MERKLFTLIELNDKFFYVICARKFTMLEERQEKLNKSIKVSTNELSSFFAAKETRTNFFMFMQTKRLFLPINFIY